jgi:alkylation response protein AidB-like acyl-CoA dehydrogenase
VTAAGDLTAAQATYGSLLARSEAIRSLVYDAVEAIEYNQEQVNLASVIKVATSELLRAVTDFGCRSSGVDALFAPIREGHARPLVSGEWFTDYINSWGLSIAQGTNEIQRNIIAERILSLPREVRRS